MITYGIIFLFLLFLELLYFKVAEKFNIIDKPNERSSHSTIVLRGGGIIFAISMAVWFCWSGTISYLPFIIGLIMIAGVSFWDDIKSLPDSLRLVVQFVAMTLMLYPIMSDSGLFSVDNWYWGVLLLIVSLILCVGTTNVINFMDGINGITAGYSLAVLIPLLLLSRDLEFVEESFLIVAILGVLVFCIFNFRPKGKAKCFAGDVGSISIAFIMLFALVRLIFQTGDITYMILLMVYGIDGVSTAIHRMMLHENLGQAHRKHAYQIMANELKIGHVKVSLLYMVMQLVVSLGFIYLCSNTIASHWIYGMSCVVIAVIAYVVFMKKYYHLHEEYLASVKN